MESQHLFVVNTNPVAAREDDFNRWYELHVREVVDNIDGFVAGQRYRLNDVQRFDARPAPWKYLTLYELEGDVDAIHESNSKVRESGIYTPYDGLLEDDHVAHVYSPVDDGYRRDGWEGRNGATHVQVVRSNPGPLGEDAYNAWYDRHIHEVVDNIDGYMGAQRYVLNASQRPGMPPSRWRYVTIYEVATDDVPAVHRSNLSARDAGAFTPNQGELADDYIGQLFVRVGDRFTAPALATG